MLISIHSIDFCKNNKNQFTIVNLVKSIKSDLTKSNKSDLTKSKKLNLPQDFVKTNSFRPDFLIYKTKETFTYL